jgi:hypothetical protein
MVKERIVTVYESTEPPNASFLLGSRQQDVVTASRCTVTLVVRTSWPPVSDDSCTPCACPVKPVDRAELSGEHGTGFAPHRCGYNYESRWVSHRERKTIDGFPSPSAGPELRHPEHRHGVCRDSASSGIAPRDPGSYSARSRCAACAASCRCPSRRSPSSAYPSSLFYEGQTVRHLPTLPIRAEDG